MILITSKKGINRTVEDVIDWIEHLGGEYRRVNGEDLIDDGFSFSEECNKASFINFNRIKVVWFRGFIDHRRYLGNIISDLSTSNENITELYFKLKKETLRFSSYFFHFFSEKNQIPSYTNININKLKVVNIDSDVGLNIPPFLVTNSKNDLLEFYNKHNNKVITKPMYETLFFIEETGVTVFKYNLISKKTINQYPQIFFPSFFQKYIEKEYEIRTFFLDGDFFSMAIFSQLDEKTKFDFRNYNNEKPNRTVPYNLPKSIKVKLKTMMDKLGLNTGSFDLIRGKDSKYYFLEVNPNGQFGMTSKPCNYYLEKRVAEL